MSEQPSLLDWIDNPVQAAQKTLRAERAAAEWKVGERYRTQGPNSYTVEVLEVLEDRYRVKGGKVGPYVLKKAARSDIWVKEEES
ncbi:MAG TPA: hypothetical protein VF192_01460 [Longimicrobiales bacterium]